MLENSINKIPDVFLQVPMVNFVLLATILFLIGIFGVLIRRNAIIIFMSIELMLNAVNLLLVTFSSYNSDPNGQIFVFFIMAVAAAESAVGLGLIIAMFRTLKTTSTEHIEMLRD